VVGQLALEVDERVAVVFLAGAGAHDLPRLGGHDGVAQPDRVVLLQQLKGEGQVVVLLLVGRGLAAVAAAAAEWSSDL